MRKKAQMFLRQVDDRQIVFCRPAFAATASSLFPKAYSPQRPPKRSVQGKMGRDTFCILTKLSDLGQGVASLLSQVIGPAYDVRGDTAPGGEIHTSDPWSRSTRVLARNTIDIGSGP
eukprot:6214095-Pleurochrysis_carterae.AAC.2